MEVHAHSHTPRRKWTHYFWEFLMLFLAVFCGFLAEYQLEHTIEHQRGKIYASNLYEELKKDTLSINEIIKNNINISGKLDTFCLFSREKNERNINTGMLYYYSNYTTSVNFFSSNNTTIEQLKGSGNLRLMNNTVSYNISEYNKKLSELENEYRLTQAEFIKMEELYFKIFDYNLIILHFGVEKDSSRDSIFKLNLPLVNNDPRLMKEFASWLKFESGIYNDHNSRFLIPLKSSATKLIALLKKEYKLK